MKKIVLLLLLISLLQAKTPHYLIIHGTWTTNFSWHMPGGDFYDALSAATHPTQVSFFLWSGKNSHHARAQAAERLVEFIEDNIPTNFELNLVTHSHGSNVANLASQIMAQVPELEKRITAVFSLGTPVQTPDYAPHMSVIQTFYNLFSFNDFIQPVFSIFQREYPAHERIKNIAVVVDGKEPMHSGMHSPVIAKWLTHIPQLVVDAKPARLYFYQDIKPIYEVDINRIAEHERDEYIQWHINNIMRTRVKR